MEIRREKSRTIDIRQYNEIKNNLYINSFEYTRECCFAREIIFGAGKETENEKVIFSLWLNRNNYDEIRLSEKYYTNGVVNYLETRLTRLQAWDIINGDYSYIDSSDNPVIRQLCLYIKYNQFKMISFKEYFEENYYNIKNADILNFRSMELSIKNDITEFFSERLKPVKDIDYNIIKANLIQKIEVPMVVNA